MKGKERELIKRRTSAKYSWEMALALRGYSGTWTADMSKGLSSSKGSSSLSRASLRFAAFSDS